MSDARIALVALEPLAAKYRAAADALDAAVEALEQVAESGEFQADRMEALEKARPFLSEETIKILSGGATGRVRVKKDRWRPPQPAPPQIDEWGG